MPQKTSKERGHIFKTEIQRTENGCASQNHTPESEVSLGQEILERMAIVTI